MSITRASLLAFMRGYRYAVESSVHQFGAPQSAVVGIAVSDDFEIVFDTLESSRKAQNLRRRNAIAFTIGSVDAAAARSVQFEGIADEPTDADRARLVALYLGVFPDGTERQLWPDVTYFRARPTWMRYSDYSVEPELILELDAQQLRALK